MKLLFLIVSLVAVFTANCRRFDEEPEEQQANSGLAQQVKGKTSFGARKPENQDYSDLKVQFNKKDERENEINLRVSKCAANAVCTILGGTCVTKSSPCTGRVVDDACKGKKAKCCIIERVSQCVNETTIQDTIKEGNDNITSVLESSIGNLESELQSIRSNLTDAIIESKGQCVDESTMKDTIKEGNDNITSVLESTIGNLESGLQSMGSNFTDAITERVSRCVDETTLKDTIKEGNDNITSVLESKIDNLESELQSIKINLTNAITGCPKGFILMSSPRQCLKRFNDQSRTWYEAKAKCEAEGMLIAIPYDPITLRAYLVTRYGQVASWIGARGDGTKYRWDRDNVTIETTNPYFRADLGHGTTGTTSNCLRLEALVDDWVNAPDQAYWPKPCTTKLNDILCELIME